MKINLLSSEVYTQIAAGEVVESPRSIVKELVENSIDAGSTAVTVYIEEGGLKSITVSDNGSGIENSEVEKAFLPHATSKISSAKDLLSISTLGFRGEALASIAAVAEVTLTTRYKDENVGTKLVVKGGEIISKETSSIDQGTNISVTNLFYNTPARFKFLKSTKTEENNVTATVQGLILANPEVSFTYYVDGKLKYFNAEMGLEAACETVLKSDFLANSIRVFEKVEDITVEGYISTPALVRGNRGGQFLIINGRVVSDATITAVVQNAYGNRLMTRSFPIYCLSVTLNPEDVDVNVHPNKTEVRLSAPKRLSGIIYRVVLEALEKYDQEKYAEFLGASPILGGIDVDATKNIQPVVPTVEEEKHGEYQKEPIIEVVQQQFDFEQLRHQMATSLDRDTLSRTIKVAQSEVGLSVFEDTITSKSSPSLMDFRVVGQIFNTYLIVESGLDVYLIDQHAAHERIRYDKFIAELDRANVQSQILLVPITMYLDSQDLTTLKDGKDQLEKIGFDVKIDDEKVEIFAIPAVFSHLTITPIIQSIIAELKGVDPLKLSTILKEKLATKACKGAIKGGDTLSMAQISMFLDYYRKSGLPLQCPHGRPAIVKLEEKDLEKLFKRIV